MDNRAVMVGGQEGILGEWGMEVSSPVYEGKIPAREALENSKIAATVRFAGLDGLAAGGGYQRRVRPAAAKSGAAAAACRRLRGSLDETGGAGDVGISPGRHVRVRKRWSIWTGWRIAAGRVVYRRQRQPRHRQQVIDSATAWQVHSMMAGSLYRGSSKGVFDGLLEKPFNGAGKGGTTH